MKGYMGKKDLRILEEEDLDDTLSLSDLILVHDDDDIGSEVSEKYYDSKSSVTSSSDDEDHTFEFFSNYKNNVVLPPENILFCGKLIPYKNNNPILSSSMSKKRSFSFSRKITVKLSSIYESGCDTIRVDGLRMRPFPK
ncbi:hypothetical protein R3W88_022435 [Solanum pinnatisectum]|uniref:Uncharacterized protein n=1 Tax=Solanum pinnatisectum TaxID=50273 RepID=A0AAV9LYI6_9SOLN|nr:hypothetical protein R3W88_022435 [Solanum pinnatisectum]